MLRLRLPETATIVAEFCGQTIRVPAARLYDGALAGNLGAIDSPAWRLHALPRPWQWQWHGRVPLGRVEAGEVLYVRLRQAGGQAAWTSPLFCRDTADAVPTAGP
jgi:hypothetical protein